MAQVQIFHDIALVPFRMKKAKNKRGDVIRKKVVGPVIHTFGYTLLDGVNPDNAEKLFRKFCQKNSGWDNWEFHFRHEHDSKNKRTGEVTEFAGWHPVPAPLITVNATL